MGISSIRVYTNKKGADKHIVLSAPGFFNTKYSLADTAVCPQVSDPDGLAPESIGRDGSCFQLGLVGFAKPGDLDGLPIVY
jgi:hypothetical protein